MGHFKTKIIATIIAFVAIVFSSLFFSSDVQAGAKHYYYGFITTCGEVFYLDVDFEMSDQLCLAISDFYESVVCGNPL